MVWLYSTSHTALVDPGSNHHCPSDWRNASRTSVPRNCWSNQVAISLTLKQNLSLEISPNKNEPVWRKYQDLWLEAIKNGSKWSFTWEVWGRFLRFHVCFYGCAKPSKSLSPSSPMRSPSHYPKQSGTLPSCPIILSTGSLLNLQAWDMVKHGAKANADVDTIDTSFIHLADCKFPKL